MTNIDFEKLDKRTQRLVDTLQLKSCTLTELVEIVAFHVKIPILMLPKLLSEEVSAFVYPSRCGCYSIVYNEQIINEPLDLRLAICHELGHILKGDVKRLPPMDDDEFWKLMYDKRFALNRAVVCSRRFEIGKPGDNKLSQQEQQVELEAELIASYLIRFIITSEKLANDDTGQLWSL